MTKIKSSETKNSQRLLTAGFAAICAALISTPLVYAQKMDWNQDVVPQLESTLKIKTLKLAPNSPAQTADDARIYGVPAAGPDSQFITAGPTDERLIFFGIDYIADYNKPSLQVIYTDFDGNKGKDGQTSKVIFDFPQLKVDLSRWIVIYKGSVIAQVREDHDSGDLFAVPTNGYHLIHQNTPLGNGSYRIDVWFGKETASEGIDYYKGTMTFAGETRNVCFGVSRKRLNPYNQSDPQIPASAPDYRRVYPFQEGGAAPGQAPGYTDECATALMDGSINACSGLVLEGAPAHLQGDVAVWNYYNIDELGLKPVGHYNLQKTGGCDPNFLFDSVGD